MRKRKKLECECSLTQKIKCPNCGKDYDVVYPAEVVWEKGTIKCVCGKVFDFKNDRIETLYI